MTSEILDNFKQHVFYHGTSGVAAQAITSEGFETGSYDTDGTWLPNSGLLGNGVYITCNWRMALWFGQALLQVSIRPGTRLLNTAEPPDPHVLRYLQREFGKDILRLPLSKVLPHNKQLTLTELVALVRYHYQGSYAWTTATGPRRSRRRPRHTKLLESLRGTLIRYGYYGFGDPKNDIGVVVFASDRLVPEGIVLEMFYDDWRKHFGDGFGKFGDLQELQHWCGKRQWAVRSLNLPCSSPEDSSSPDE